MTDSIFEGVTAPVVPAEPSTPTSNIPTELADIVGEGKKYHSVEDALKSVGPAQAHILKLEAEAAQMKEELLKRQTAEDLLEQLRESVGEKPTEKPSVASLTSADIEQQVEQLLVRKQAQSTASANISKVVQIFQDSFGDKAKAEEAYIKIARESGMDVPTLNKLAATSPMAVLKLAGLSDKQPQAGSHKTGGSVNTESLSQSNSQELSSKVAVVGSTTKDLVQAIKNARAKVDARYNS